MSLMGLAGVAVREGARTILDVGALEVHAGETLAVLGPTGAGKSTLLRVLSLLRRPDAGSVRWRGEEVGFPPPLALRRRITMAFQDPLLFSGTTFENVAYGLRLRGERGEGLRRTVIDTLKLLHIEERAEQRADRLSGGEAQRAALARALVIRPELLLLDEPLASLDEPIRVELRRELGQIVRRHGLTCVLVTHDQAEAWALGERIAVMEGGRVEQVGTPEEVFSRPATAFVAGFVRTGNTLPGRVVGSAGGVATVAVGVATLEARSPLPPGRRVLACVRPEEIAIGRNGRASGGAGETRLAARVAALRNLLDTVEVELDCGFPLVARLTRRSARELALAEGERVHVSLIAEAVHLIPDGEGADRALDGRPAEAAEPALQVT